MNKNKKQIKERRKYIKEYIDKRPNTTKAIKKLSKKLFLSESTIEKDYRQSDDT
jgi:DeoR/GlpR family transcriptional regulator of sugar metabolism